MTNLSFLRPQAEGHELLTAAPRVRISGFPEFRSWCALTECPLRLRQPLPPAGLR
jgi:hypothetical protein